MKRVVIESPYAGKSLEDRAANIAYAKRCVLDCLERGEAPYASHLFFAQDGILDDDNPAQRDLGIQAGLDWGRAAEATVVYLDRGISNGMRIGVKDVVIYSREILFRSLHSTTFDWHGFNWSLFDLSSLDWPPALVRNEAGAVTHARIRPWNG